METIKPVQVCLRAAVGNPHAFGHCPASHTVLLILEEKDIPYDVRLIDVEDMPKWFLEMSPERKLPAANIDGKWVFDLEVIAETIDDRYPIPPLDTHHEFTSIGSEIFSSFVRFFRSTDPSDGSEKALLDELRVLDEHLKVHGPYIEGDDLTSHDLVLAPQLYHMEVVLEYFKHWTIPEYMHHFKAYTELLFTTFIFIKTKASEDNVISGWEPQCNV